MVKTTVLGGGCFWGMQDLIRKQEGVVNTVVGFSGGSVENPTYESHAGHAEVVKIQYDTQKTSFRDILDFFFRIHDPTTVNRQGNDQSTSYRSIIFYGNEKERKEARAFISLVNASKRWDHPVVTMLEPFKTFTKAEEYHQNYLAKNPDGYTCHVIRFSRYL